MNNSAESKAVEQLQQALGEKAVLTGGMIGTDFCRDEFPGEPFIPIAVVEATSTEDISLTMKICSNNGVTVTVRGAGTGQAGGSVPINGGIVLSLRKMNRILEVNESERIIRVQPGALLQDVKAEAIGHSLYYPPDPGEQTATIGGNAATNAGGPCAVKYGTTRDYVVNAVLVMADGTVEQMGGREEYSEVIGSEGSFAIIAELTLRLIEKPGADAILLFPFLDSATCLKAAEIIAGSDFRPAVIEYMDTDIIEFSGQVTGNTVFPVELDGERVGATLMVTVEGDNDDAVMEKMEALAEFAEKLECMDILVGDTAAMKKEFWAAHDAFHTSMESGAKNAVEYNICVPGEKISDMVTFVGDLGEEKELRVMTYAHAGSGGMHIHAVSDCSKEKFAETLAGVSGAIYTKCRELGGNIRGEYGYGYAKKSFLSDDERSSFAAIKKVFDPHNILNRGKVID